MRILLILAAVSILVGCGSAPPPPTGLLAPKQFYVPAGNEELYGTWVNPALRVPTFYPKLVYSPWGLVEMFSSIADETYDWRGTSTIVAKWEDGEGRIWYKEFARCSLKGFYAGHSFNLIRISDSGMTLECVFGNLDWPNPSELDPEVNPTYVKYRRLE